MKSNVLFLVLTSFIFFTAKSQNIEDFSSAKLVTTYSTNHFIGNDSITWNYVNARGGQTTTTNKNAAISLNKSANACLFSDTLPLGIKSLQFQYEQELTSNCNAKVYINDSCIATLTTSGEADITKMFIANNIYFTGNIVIKIVQATATSGQITIDDITFEYAQKPIIPFVINGIELTDSSAKCTYSHIIKSANIHSEPDNCIKNYEIIDNSIKISFLENICGNYKIHINSVLDTGLLSIADTSLVTYFTAKPQWKQITISEIMVDPSPQVGLPNYEYVEIYNSSTCAINCKDLELQIGETKINLPHHILQANSYVYFISKEAFPFITDTNSVCFVESLPALLNEGQKITLQTTQYEVLSQIHYSSDWYTSNFKKDGGWSLEKIDVTNYSETDDNWSAANNYTGGTPGFENSNARINLDTIAPEITSIYIENDSTIQITFSENMSPNSIDKNISFLENLEIIEIQNQNSLQTYSIKVSPKLVRNKEYTCFISHNLTDIAGNFAIKTEYPFAITDSILQRNSILISEILFNPKPNNFDFIELYNHTNSYFDCSKLYIANIDSTSGDVNSFTKLSESPKLFPPHSFAVISDNSEFIKQSSLCSNEAIWLSISTMPSMPDDNGTIILLNVWGKIIDSLTYDEKWHSKSLQNNEGVSLERLDYKTPTYLSSNWYSSSTIGNGATLGCKNSQMIDSAKQLLEFKSTIITPNNDGDNDFLELQYTNNEIGSTMNMYVFSINGSLIKHVINNELIASNGIIIWDGSNENNKLVEAGIYIVLIELFKDGKRTIKDKKTCTILYE